MPEISSTELKERFNRDLPGALAPERAKPAHSHNGHAAEPPAKGKKGDEGPVDLLATNDAVVLAERIPDVAQYVRDTLGYEFLTDLTAVDYLADLAWRRLARARGLRPVWRRFPRPPKLEARLYVGRV